MHRGAREPADRGHQSVLVESAAGRARRWGLLAGPGLLLAVIVALVVVTNPVASLRGPGVVAEELAVESVRLGSDLIEVSVRNVSPSEVTLAQVLVNDAYWNHQAGDRQLARLQSTTITIRYPWDEGLPLHLSFLTATGTRIDHEIPIALTSPDRGPATAARYAGLGLLIGVVPVGVGLLWLPALRTLSRRARDGVVGFTAGLLAFLLVDTAEEAIEVAARAGAAVDALGLVAVGATIMIAAIVLVEDLADRRNTTTGMRSQGLAPAYALALAIGLHNLGEGLAVSSAVAIGEASLGATLLLGFILHNSTEGLAIAMPFGPRQQVDGRHLVGLVAVAGLPACVGAVAGSWSIAPAWIALALGAALGALAQVLWALRPTLATSRDHRAVIAIGFTVGIAVMYITGLLAS